MYPYGWGETSVEGRALAGAYRVGGPEAALELRDSAVPLRVPRAFESPRWFYIDRTHMRCCGRNRLGVQIRASLTPNSFELQGEAEGRHDEVAFLAYLNALERVGLFPGTCEAFLPAGQLAALQECVRIRPPAPGAKMHALEAWTTRVSPRVPAISWVGTLPAARWGRALVAAHFDRPVAGPVGTAWAAYARRAAGLLDWSLVAVGPGPGAVDRAIEVACVREYERLPMYVDYLGEHPFVRRRNAVMGRF